MICSNCTEIVDKSFKMEACKIKEIIQKIFMATVKQIKHLIPNGVSMATFDRDR